MDVTASHVKQTGVPPSTVRSVPAVGEAPGGVELLHFAQTLSAAGSYAELRRRFATGFGRLLGVPMWGLYTHDGWTGRAVCVASGGVSERFLARYERGGRELNWMQHRLDATGRAVYNLALMSMEEWLADPLYTQLKYLHDIRHEVLAPVVNRHGVVGTLHAGTSDAARGFTPYQVRLTEAVARLTGTVIEGIESRAGLERERDQAVVALDGAGAAVVITDPIASEPRLNEAARCLLAEVVDADRELNRLLTGPGAGAGSGRGFSRHVEVALADGSGGLLRGHSTYTRDQPGALITVLELQRDRVEISTQTLTALTPREREVALLVVDGRSDRQIAERLHLSHHTVSQYVKRIYRKLDVPSRVTLTRLLLDHPNPTRQA
jgi:DNA-binding CsgD family transcriptional regulator/GAF domain-containing protein